VPRPVVGKESVVVTLRPDFSNGPHAQTTASGGNSGFTDRAVRSAGIIAAIGLAGFVTFQVALALGAPLGAAAWGGADRVLSSGLRVASGLAALLLVVAAFAVLGRAGYWRVDRHRSFFHWGTWGAAALLAMGALGNLASSSDWERFLNGPIALLLALACLVVALGSRGRDTS
jgi:hypothetical protein